VYINHELAVLQLPSCDTLLVNSHHGNINKICRRIYKKSADKIVEDRTCFSGRQNRPILSIIYVGLIVYVREWW